MPYFDFHWNDRIIEHLEEHDVTPEDFEDIVCYPVSKDTSDSSGRPVAFGYTSDGRFVMAVYEMLDEMTVLPVTAYEVEEPY